MQLDSNPSLVTSDEPLSRHFLAIFLLAGCAALGWWYHNRAAYLHIDERAYFAAFDQVNEGASPYDVPAYLYPPPLAVVGAKLNALWGERTVSLVLRHLNLVGGSVAVWLALAWVGWPRSLRLVLSLALVLLSPAFATGVVRTNLSLLAIGVTLAGFFLWSRRPWLAGGLLGMGLVVKPLAPVGLLVLFLHRPSRPGRRHWIAALTAGGSAVGLLLIGLPFLPEMLANLGGRPQALRITSLHRLFYAFGLEVPPLLIAFAVAMAAGLLVRRRRLSGAELVSVATAASLLSLPIVWSHTMLLALPLQAMGVALAFDRLRRRVSQNQALTPFLWHETVPVLLAVISIFLSNGFGAMEEAPAWLLGLLIAVPTFSPAALAAYILTRGAGEPGEANQIDDGRELDQERRIS